MPGLHAVAGLLPLLPPETTERLLDWPERAGELLDLMGCTPASLADLTAHCLLPALLPASAAAAAGVDEAATAPAAPLGPHQQQLLSFVVQHWGSIKGHEALRAHLAQVTWVPSVVAAGAEACAGDGGCQVCARPGELFDPSVPLLGSVLATAGASLRGRRAGCGLFPAREFATPAWLQVSVLAIGEG